MRAAQPMSENVRSENVRFAAMHPPGPVHGNGTEMHGNARFGLFTSSGPARDQAGTKKDPVWDRKGTKKGRKGVGLGSVFCHVPGARSAEAPAQSMVRPAEVAKHFFAYDPALFVK